MGAGTGLGGKRQGYGDGVFPPVALVVSPPPEGCSRVSASSSAAASSLNRSLHPAKDYIDNMLGCPRRLCSKYRSTLVQIAFVMLMLQVWEK
jgi:hypothetical protein